MITSRSAMTRKNLNAAATLGLVLAAGCGDNLPDEGRRIEVETSPEGLVTRFDVDDRAIYYAVNPDLSSRQQLVAMPIGGGASKVIGEGYISAVLVADDQVFYVEGVDSGASELRRTGKDGRGNTVVATGLLRGSNRLAFDATSVYTFLDGDPNSITVGRVSRTASEPTTAEVVCVTPAFQLTPYGLTVAGDSLFFSVSYLEGGHDDHLWKCLTAGTGEAATKIDVGASAFAGFGTDVYYSVQADQDSWALNRLPSDATTASDATNVIAIAGRTPSVFTADASHVYWFEAGPTGIIDPASGIWRASLSGGGVTQIADTPTYFAGDLQDNGTRIFWVEWGSDTLPCTLDSAPK